MIFTWFPIESWFIKTPNEISIQFVFRFNKQFSNYKKCKEIECLHFTSVQNLRFKLVAYLIVEFWTVLNIITILLFVLFQQMWCVFTCFFITLHFGEYLYCEIFAIFYSFVYRNGKWCESFVNHKELINYCVDVQMRRQIADICTKHYTIRQQQQRYSGAAYWRQR